MQKPITLFILLLLTINNVYCAELTWNIIRKEADNKNTALIKARQSVEQSQQYYRRAYTSFLPNFSANASAGHSDSNSNNYSKDFSYGVSGSISIFSGLSDLNDTKSKYCDYKIALASYRRVLSDTIYGLKKCFIELIWAQESVALDSEILKRRKENYEMIQLKYEAGREDKGSLLRVEADMARSEYDLAKAKRYLQTASLQLIKTIGMDGFDTVSTDGKLLPVTLPEKLPLAQLITNTPEYEIAKFNLEKSDYQIKTAESSFYPELSLSGAKSKSGDQWAAQNDRWNIGLNLTYPLFSGGKNTYDIKIAKISKSVSQESFKEQQYQLASKINSSINDLIDSIENVAVSEKYLKASEAQSQITSAKYVNGLISYQDWYSIEENYISAQNALLNAKKNAMLAESQMKNVIGIGE